MTEWFDIGTAPKDVFIDIMAKCWLPEKDVFIYRRFPDCRWRAGDNMSNSQPHWGGLEKGWRAICWMPVPEVWT